MRVLVVEDEPRLAQNIAAGLREGASFAVDVARDGQRALDLCSTEAYDLIILDLMLPMVSGREVLTRLRTGGVSAPVLVLTAVSQTVNKVDLFEQGADDYLTKPFDLGELLARSKALIRRSLGAAHPLLEHGSLKVNTATRMVSCQGAEVDLSATEYRILEYLMYRPRLVVSKQELLEHLYDFSWQHHSNVIEAHVSNLRRKLRTCEGAAGLETLRGRGYRLAAAAAAL